MVVPPSGAEALAAGGRGGAQLLALSELLVDGRARVAPALGA